MTNVDYRPSSAPMSSHVDEPLPSGWTGWVLFASVLMTFVGVIHLMQGFVALFDHNYYAVTSNGLVIQANYTTWGWTHLIFGVAILVAGLFLPTGAMLARILAVVLVGLSLIANLLFIASYPVWSIIVITIDVLVIYAITVHGKELRTYDA